MMRVALRNNEIPATLNAFSAVIGLPPGALKKKVARMVAATLRTTSSIEVDPFTEAELDELLALKIEPSLAAFLLPFVESAEG